jgi:aminobenzoyl-glutamate utilization protein B
MSDVKSILDRIIKVAKGAAMMTETDVEVKIEHGCCEMLPNKKFADLTYNVMKEVPLPAYTPNELQYAAHLQSTVNPAAVKAENETYGRVEILHSALAPRELAKSQKISASSDSGDVSYIMPMNLFTTACWPFGVAPHTWQASAASGSNFGAKGALYAAKVLASVGYELLTNPAKTEEIIQEFKDKKAEYSPMYQE